MSSALYITRLRKELRELKKNPVMNIQALPKENNILEWHYVIEGAKGSPFEGGWYHGVVLFPKEYPYKPPSIQMITPNGRFKCSTPLCLSMSDFHPESWNPLWSVGTILMGLLSFMLENTPTTGSLVSSDAAKRNFAYNSLEFNTKNKVFKDLFPDLVDLHEAIKMQRSLLVPSVAHDSLQGSAVDDVTTSNNRQINVQQSASWSSILGVLAAILCCTWAVLTFAL